MGKRSGPREPLSLASFERALEEEMSVSAEFDLPLTLMVVRVGGVLDAETTLRLLDTLRAADLVAIPSASELAVVLPNTTADGAGALEPLKVGVGEKLDAVVGVDVPVDRPELRPEDVLERERRAFDDGHVAALGAGRGGNLGADPAGSDGH